MYKNRLKAAIVKKGLKIEEFISLMNDRIENNFTKDSYYARVSGKVEFRRCEIKACKEILSLTDDEVADIFFNEEVS